MAEDFESGPTPGPSDPAAPPGETRRQRRRRNRRRRKEAGEPLPGLYLAPHLVTTANLFFGFFAIVQAFAGKPDLAAGGIMVMDMMGGGECYEEDHRDVRTIKKGKHGFKYVWTQDTFNPINHDARFTIGFKFKDGSRLDEAFVYEWRFWTIPEVREMLAEAGFASSHVYWEVDHETGDGEAGQWERREDAPSDPSWVCYLVAVK